jgi:hypothetical protein
MNVLISFIDSLVSPIRSLFNWLASWVPGMQRLAGMPLPWLVAIATFLVLLILIGVDVLLFTFGPEDDRRFYFRWAIPLCGLGVIIVGLSYFITYLLMQKEESLFPDIDLQWDEGMRLLTQQGIDLLDTPLILVLGADDGEVAQRIAGCSGLPFLVNNCSESGGGLAFVANHKAIFLFANGCNCLSKLSFNRSANASKSSSSDDEARPVTSTRAALKTLDESPDSFEDSETSLSRITSSGSRSPVGGRRRGTETLDGDPDEESFDVSVAKIDGREANLSPNEAAECRSRLEYLSKKICKSRYPICPANGLAVLLPFELIELSAAETQLAVQEDIKTLQENLMVRVPAIALVTEMETHEGFVEMIDRIGLEKVQGSRFGKGCEVLGDASAERLKSVATHAVASFEKRIYEIFGRPESLRKKTNWKLYSFMARLRKQFEGNLTQVISAGFSRRSDIESGFAYEPFFFAGCYFAAAGDVPEKQAFVGAALDKLLEDDGGCIEWNSDAIRKNQEYLMWANLVMLLGGAATLALIGLAGFVIWKMTG